MSQNIDKLQALQEHERRGNLPEQYRGAYDEAVKRGLIQSTAPQQEDVDDLQSLRDVQNRAKQGQNYLQKVSESGKQR